MDDTYFNKEETTKTLIEYFLCSHISESFIKAVVDQIPAADVRPVVLCRDCEYWQSDCGWCGYFDIGMNIDDFCSRGKKEES